MRTACIIILYAIFAIASGHAQEKGYRIEGDRVIFTFNINDYNTLTRDSSGKKLNAEQVDIESVSLSGEFNNWLLEGWEMKRISPGVFQLERPLNDFDSRANWEFKYVINNTYWAEPDTSFGNITESRKGNFWLDVYNLNLYPVSADEHGNTTFRLEGFEEAKEVVLSGSFNKWNEYSLKMDRVKNGWEITLDLPPGKHTYKFIADGEWLHDPGNPDKTYNEYGGYNSVISVCAPTVFRLASYPDAREVYLAGSFNQWNTKELPMKRVDNAWVITADLTGGKHHYKFIVDGKWITDPENEILEYDTNGHLNSVIMIK